MAFRAVDLALLVQSGSPLAYGAIGAIREATLQLQHSEEDITSKGDNQARRLYPEGSLKSASVTGQFVVTDEPGFEVLRAAAESAVPKIDAKLDDGVSVYTGEWLIASWQVQGGSSGAVMGSVTLQSSGPITVSASA